MFEESKYEWLWRVLAYGVLAAIVWGIATEPRRDRVRQAEKRASIAAALAEIEAKERPERQAVCRTIIEAEGFVASFPPALEYEPPDPFDAWASAARQAAGEKLLPWERNKAPCNRFEFGDCFHKVPRLLAVEQAGARDLAERLSKIGDRCEEDLAFARKHGLAAYADHRRLLDDAIDQAKEDERDRRDNGPELEPPDW